MSAVRQIAEAGGHALPEFVAPAEVLTPVDRDGGGSNTATWLAAVLFAGVFLTAWLWYEVRNRTARRGPRTATT